MAMKQHNTDLIYEVKAGPNAHQIELQKIWSEHGPLLSKRLI